MEKDIDLIVDVEPDEAELLIGLIETLIHDWYIVRHEREARLKKLVQSSAEKEAQRRAEAASIAETPSDGSTPSDAVG